jgi:hypothetical protein
VLFSAANDDAGSIATWHGQSQGTIAKPSVIRPRGSHERDRSAIQSGVLAVIRCRDRPDLDTTECIPRNANHEPPPIS